MCRVPAIICSIIAFDPAISYIMLPKKSVLLRKKRGGALCANRRNALGLSVLYVPDVVGVASPEANVSSGLLLFESRPLL